MKRILVFSDTHNNIRFCEDIINKIPSDLIIHAGDYTDDAAQLKRRFPDRELIYVRGNCDMFSYARDEEVTEVGGVRLFIAHGHRHRVKYEHDYHTLALAAKNNGCAAAVFGHTHVAFCDRLDGVLLLNPGSAKYTGTYGIIEIEDGIPRACIMREEMLF